MKNSETSSPVQIQGDNDSLVSMRDTKKSSMDSDRQYFSRQTNSNPKSIQPMLINEPEEFEISIEEKAALLKKAHQNFYIIQNIKNKMENSSGLPTVHEDDDAYNKSEFANFLSSGKGSQSGAYSEIDKFQESKLGINKKLKQTKTKAHLTNQFSDEEGILQGFKEGLQKKVAQKIQNNLLLGSIQDKISQKVANKNTTIFDTSRKFTKKNLLQLQEIEDPNSPTKVKIERKEEGDGFFYNFKIIQMHTAKCLVAQSLKLGDRKFMFKMLNPSTVNLYRINQLKQQGVEFDFQKQKPPDGFVNFDIVKDWALLPPQLENQNFQTCYGVMKVKNNYFTVCDLIEDYVILPFQTANLNLQDRNHGIKKILKDAYYLDNEKRNQKHYIIPNNMYDQIRQMNLGNISNFENIPIFYVKILLEYIIHISRAFSYLHLYNVVHGAFNLSRVVIQKKEIIDYKSLQIKINNALKQYSQGIESSQVKSQKKGQDDSDSSSLVEHPDEKVFEDLLNMNFVIINFEPWIVESLQKKFEVDSSLLKDLLSSDILQLQQEDYLQISKIFDLQAFGQSIIEIMVGKPKESKLKVQIDSIPLKWSKLPEITQIFEILHMCVGPYDFNNNIQDVNTSKVFQNINKIASDLLEQLNFREKAINENKNSKQELKELQQISQQPSPKHLSRIKSAQLNNLASIMIYQISDRVNEETRRIVLSNIEKTLQDSINLCQDNAVAHLNFILFKWSIGEIKDEDFMDFVTDQLYKKDQNAARLMYILFKNNVMGNIIDQKEILEHLEIILNNPEILSNLAINLLQNKTFQKEIFMYQQKQLEMKEDENTQERRSPKRELLDQFEQIQDSHVQTLTVENDNNIFKGQKFFFSNNENYVGFVGQKQFIVIDSRSGNIILRQNLPEKVEQQQNHLSETEEHSLQQTPYNHITSQDEKILNDKILSVSRDQSEMDNNLQKRSFTSSEQSDEEGKVHQVILPLTIQTFNDVTPQSQQEKLEIEQRIPSNWIGDIQNTGKIVALFDISQQERNKVYKHKVNKEEVMLLYVLQTRLQNSAITKNIFKIDVHYLLNQQEVLNFGFDDFNQNQHCICIQAKDLYLYIIDYMQHNVLRKIDNYRYSIVLKSIFYNIQNDEYNQKVCQFVKEYIQTQEQQGNRVLLPKLNDKFLAIQYKNSNLIKIFSIEQKRIVRQFSLLKDSALWAEKTFDEEQDEERSQNKYQKNSKYQQKTENDIQLRKQIRSGENDQKDLYFHNLNGFLNVFQFSSRFRGIKNFISYVESREEESDESISQMNNTTVISEDSQIDIIDISPQGRMIVSLNGNDILIRAVNYYAKTDEIESFIEQQKMSAFLPIYQDQDYNISLIYKELLLNYRNSKLVQKFQDPVNALSEDEFQKQDFTQQYSQIKNEIITAANIIKITSGTIEKACRFFQNQLKIPAVQNKKSDKLIEVQKFYNVFQKHFQLIYESNINPKKKFNKIEQCLQLVKEFQNLDLKQIQVEYFIGMSKLNTLQSFKFDRSYEYISSFTSSSMSVQTVAVNAITPQAFFNYCATVVNRKVQVYNFISGMLLFEIKIPNASLYCRKNKEIASYKSISFMDADNLLVFQDGESRLCVINVKTQIEAFGDKNLKQVNKDITIKIDKLMGDEESVNYDFGLTLDEKDDKQDKGSDHSDHTGEAQSSKRYIDFGDKIERIFFCRAGSDSAYVALISKMRFTIYFLQEDYIQPCEFNVAIDMDYRLKREIASMGQIISLDFDDESMTFVTCTKFGWICFWTYQKKSILQKVRIESKFVDPCNIIKYYNQREMVVCFFSRSYKLLLIKIDGLKNKINDLFSLNVSPDHSKNTTINEKQDSQLKAPIVNQKIQPKNDKKQEKKSYQATASLLKIEEKKQEPVKVIEPEPQFEIIDLTQHLSYEQKQQRGDVCQIEIDRQYTFLFVVYEKNYLAVFNLLTLQELQVYGPFNASKIFIDEMCTYIAILDEYQKQISYLLLNFQHKIENMGTQRLSQERKSKSQDKSNKHLKLVSGVEVLFEENENDEEDGNNEKEVSPIKKDEEVKSLEENDASKACNLF